MDWGSLAMAVFSAIVYALSMYVKKHLNSDTPQDFDAAKFVTTVIWGAIVGVVVQYTGVEITEQTVEEQFAIYTGLIAITENIIKAIIRAIKR